MVDKLAFSGYQVRAAAETDSGIPEVLIYGSIGAFWDGVVAADFVKDFAAIDADAITVKINSDGGDVFDGIAILNALRGHPATVTTVVDGLAASIASVIALGGDNVIMNKNSQMMIHNAWDFVVGNADKLQQAADRLRSFSANLASIYAEKAGGDVADWQALMDTETWYTAEEAVEAGLADSVIVEAVKTTSSVAAMAHASADLSRFKYAGRQAAPAPRIVARAQTPQPVEAEETQRKEPIVASLNEKSLEALGLDAEADDDAIEAAITAVVEKANTEPVVEVVPAELDPAELQTAAAKFNAVMVDKPGYDKLLSDAAAGAQARAQQVAESDERTIHEALRSGRITPASADTWRAQLKENRDGVKALLATMPANAAVPVHEIGHGVDNEDSQLETEMASAFNKVTGRVYGKEA